MPIKESGQLNFLDTTKDFMPGFSMYEANGHTEAMMLPLLKYKDTTVAFLADLIPSAGHIPIPYVMGYDVRPLNTLKEKEYILKQAAENNWTLFFEHDPTIECCTVSQTERGIRLEKSFDLGAL